MPLPFNVSYGESIVSNKEMTVSDPKMTVSSRNMTVPNTKMTISNIEKTVSDQNVTVSKGRKSFGHVLELQGYSKKTASRIKIAYNFIEYDIFGRSEIMILLHISDSTAGRLIDQMRTAGLIVPVSGHGKGKYRFITEEDETERSCNARDGNASGIQ
ncbi:MAG: hypothetical protein LUF35_00705 [Lachnospiraceae bacterium]|nr:hypothetical protein [Lachnospiraceae bacterium]